MAAAKGNRYSSKYSDEDLKKIADGLIEWAHSGKGIYISSYVYQTYKRPKAWLYNLGEHNPIIKEALNTARELIAGKVANHCFEGDKNSAFGEKILPMYCKDYKALLEYKARLSQSTPESIKTTFSELKNAISNGSLLDMLKQEDGK